MRKISILFSLLFISISALAQNQTNSSSNKTANDSTLIKIQALVEDIDFRIHGLDRYKLYPTENIYNFLQLDTMTGKIEIVQWSLDDDKEGSATLNNEDLSDGLREFIKFVLIYGCYWLYTLCCISNLH